MFIPVTMFWIVETYTGEAVGMFSDEALALRALTALNTDQTRAQGLNYIVKRPQAGSVTP